MNKTIFSPLEQFENSFFVILIENDTNGISLGIVNMILAAIAIEAIFLFFLEAASIFKTTKLLKISNITFILSIVVKEFLALIKTNVGIENLSFTPLVMTVGLLLIILNILGVFPFGLTLTAQLIIPLLLSIASFIAINTLGIIKHKEKFTNLFLPNGTPFLLIPFLVFIELLSYSARSFSLGLRLFANLMAGHTLLKILLTAIFASYSIGGGIVFINCISLLLIQAITIMEVGIAIVQAYVFIILLTLYIHDSQELH